MLLDFDAQKAHRPQKSKKGYITIFILKTQRKEARMKRWVYWVGLAAILAIEFYLMANKILVIHSGALFSLGGFWLWRGIAAGLLKVEGIYKIEQFTRKREKIMAVLDFCMGLSWIAISLTEASTQLVPILLVSVPFIIAATVVCYYKNEKTE